MKSGLYIHIPFCHSKCAYCDFYSMPRTDSEHRLIDCLISEWEMRRDEVGEIGTVYIGGGTPSILSCASLERLAEAMPISGASEVTIEANPEDVKSDKVIQWKSLGINRLSMGIQSFSDTELSLIGRRHTAAQALAAVEAIEQCGIDNYSLDLIYGLPGQTLESWKASLNEMMRIRPKHFSAYMLSYEPRTRLTAMLQSGKIEETPEETLVEMYNTLIDTARSQGYEHYEISNFSLPGFRAKHNSSYWHDVPYLGLGPSAHSFDGNDRRVNPANLKEYLQVITSGTIAYEVEEETPEDRLNDKIITSLRTSDGLEFGDVPRRKRMELMWSVYKYVCSGMVEVDGTRLRIPESQWLISDAIFRDLMV